MSDTLPELFSQPEIEQVRQEISRATNEPEDDYFNRMMSFWQERFKNTLTLLPHHWVSSIEEVTMFNETSSNLEGRMRITRIKEKKGAAIMRTEDFTISDHIPQELKAKHPELNSEKPYGSDQYTSETELEFAVNRAAITTAMALLNESSIRVTCDPREQNNDPICLISHVFGDADHCRISFRANELASEAGQAINDIKLIQKLAQTIASMDVPKIKIEEGIRPPITASLTIPSSIAFGEIAYQIVEAAASQQ